MFKTFSTFTKAVSVGDVDAVRKLIRPDWIDREYNGIFEKGRAIHVACNNGHANVVQLLLERGCDMEAKDKEGRQAIHYACRQGHIRIVQRLLDKGCQIETEDNTGQRPIHFACQNGHVNIVQLLLNSGAEMETADKNNHCPLHYACENGHVDVAKLLLDKGCNIEAETTRKKSTSFALLKTTYQGIRPIHFACIKGHTEVVKLLLEKKCLIETTDENGNKPLHYACISGSVGVVQLLLNEGCQVETADKKGWRPVHYACKHGHARVTEMLIKRGCQTNVKTKDGQGLLDVAKESNNGECIRMIKRSLKMIEEAFSAARSGNITLIRNILHCPLWTREFHANDPSKTGQTLLEAIIQTNSMAIIKSISCSPESDKDIIDFLSLDRNDFTDQSYELLRQWLVHCCIRHNIDWAFMRLCNADMVNNTFLPDGTTCLDVAVEYRRSLCVRHILNKYVEPDDSWDRARNVAVQKRYEEIIDLIQHRETELQRNKAMDRNRLHLAVLEGDSDVMEYIVRKGLANHSVADQNGDPPLMLAVANRMDECANTLKQLGADVNAVNKHGQTILHAVVIGKMDLIPQWLFNEFNDIDRRDCMGLTALQQAVVADLESLVEELVLECSDHRSTIRANVMSTRFKTATAMPDPHCDLLQLTSKENSSSLCLKLHGRIYPCLLDNFTRSDANFSDRDENSLLHLTALLMDVDGCKKLLQKGAVVDAKNKCMNTPLVELLAYKQKCGRGIDDKALLTVRCLIDGGANIADEHSSGETALQMAIGILDERLLLEMIRHDSDVNRITSGDFDKFLKHKMNKFVEIVLPKMTEALAKECITVERIRSCMDTLPQTTTKTMFSHAQPSIQQGLINELMHWAARQDDVEYFDHLLRIFNGEWKLMSNGESLLTALIKERNTPFCVKLMKEESGDKLIDLANADGNSPLMIAIETGMDELIDDLIADAREVDCENAEGQSALSMLFSAASIESEEQQNRLKIWIKNLIKASADIYRVNRHNKPAIGFCSSEKLKSEIQTFFRKQKQKDKAHVCCVCMDRMVSCVVDCGHTFCTECINRLSTCPVCRKLIISRKHLVFP